ncbi:MAG: alpha/beta fold hydrolase [Terracidiphilus sp.]|nr:alpha/beta fold hydrolase [Terracidiphilus sp.]MDR3798225.1 alpha/beta fold hydrolase [Terracidiphilus sp.]
MTTSRPKHLIKRTLWSLLALALLAGIGFYLRPVSYLNAWTYLQEDLSGIESSSVQVAGHRVHYLAEGPANGPVVVLVHGLGASAEHWSNLAPYLAQSGFRVYIPDLIGYGRSEQPADFSYSVRDEAAVVVGFMDTLGLKQVELGGWSMGGWIAALVAAEHPERVSRLMLFDSAGLDVPPTFDTSLFIPSTTVQLDQLKDLLSPQSQPIPAFIARDMLRDFRLNGWVVQRALATMLTAQDVVDNLLPQLKMPVLLVWGSLDRVTPLSDGDIMHRLIPQSQLDVFAGCGHMAPIECSAEVGPKVVAFARE